MIIPDSLSPFPGLPRPQDSKDEARMKIDDFVCDIAVRELLVGPMLVTPLITTRVPNGGGYAGRDDLAEDDSPFVTLSSDESYADEASQIFEPKSPHPALAPPRSAAPPQPRIEPEKGFGQRDRSDRWWVIGMGVALLVILGSGTMIEIISSEAVRRSQISQETQQPEAPPITLPVGKPHPGSQPLASSNPEYSAP